LIGNTANRRLLARVVPQPEGLVVFVRGRWNVPWRRKTQRSSQTPLWGTP